MIFRFIVLASVIFIATSPALASTTSAPYEFVTIYIRTLSNLETVRDNAEKDMRVEANSERLAGCVRNMESFRLELTGDISAMRAVHLTGQGNGVPQQFADFFEIKRSLYQRMGDYCAQMLAGPKP